MSSLLPFLLDYDQPRAFNPSLSLALTPEDLVALSSPKYYRILSKLPIRDYGPTVRSNKENFQVNLDVHHFAPDEINVKTVDGCVVIEGRHEEKRDEHGWVSRQFTRRYALPEGCDVENVQSRLSSDGVLTVFAPRTSKSSNERVVPIMHTGPLRTRDELKPDGDAPKNLENSEIADSNAPNADSNENSVPTEDKWQQVNAVRQ